MNVRLVPDPEMLELVRCADPMRDPRVRASAGLDTEAALGLLTPALDRPPARRRAPRRRTGLRAALLVGMVAVAAFAAANLASDGSGSAVSAAQARTIIRHARAALLFPPHAILEEEVASTVTGRDRSRQSTSEVHEWLSTSPPYDNRQIIIQGGRLQSDQATVDGRLNLYDPRTRTVYLAPASAPRQVPDDPNVNSALAEVRYLLGQPSVTVNPHAVLDGAPAIEFTFDRGRFSYWASPRSYRPLRSEDRRDSLPGGQGAVGIDRYPIDRVLAGASASRRLLSLAAQHPGAAIDRRSADYAAALRRLLHERLHPGSPPRRTRR